MNIDTVQPFSSRINVRMDEPKNIYVGCAGWSITRDQSHLFPGTGSHLERYAQRLPAVEINSSFYRPHKKVTYARWGSSVPESFRFAVKVPKEITHQRRLVDVSDLTLSFLSDVEALGDRLGPLLVQLPPSLEYDEARATEFFGTLRNASVGAVVCEPRHASWFTSEVDAALVHFRVARVAADPAILPLAAEPSGWDGVAYFRRHGSPQRYYSTYSKADIKAMAERLRTIASSDVPAWCIFDNTAAGAAVVNTIELLQSLGDAPSTL